MKTDKSKKLFIEANKLLPGGVNSPVRAFKNVNLEPIFFKSASGPILVDEDDNQYIDFVGSWGPMILGHANPKVINAISEQAQQGTSYGAPTRLENELAKVIKECMPNIEKLRMVNSGTEATMSCIRLARGVTNKNKIIKFDGCYHGHVDSLLVKSGSGISTFGLPDSPGVPKDLAKYTISLPFNDTDTFLKVFEEIKDDLAAVIVEPVAGNMGLIRGNKDFLGAIREKTTLEKVVLIFDEVMSGFRVALGGAQEIYDIKPDLTALGKIIGGGLPVGAFGGKATIMDDLAPMGSIYQAGTLSGNPLAMAAGISTLKELKKSKPYDTLEENIKELLTSTKKLFTKKGLSFCFDCIGGMFGFFMSNEVPLNYSEVSNSDNKLFERFFKACLKQGVYFAPSKFESGFISTSHDKKIMKEANNKIELAIKDL